MTQCQEHLLRRLPIIWLACLGGSDIGRAQSARTKAYSSTVIVSPAGMADWSFVDGAEDDACIDTARCHFVAGPNGAPLGHGSVVLASTTTRRAALMMEGLGGTRLDRLTALGYMTYVVGDNVGLAPAGSMDVNVDYDLADSTAGNQGRLVYEPAVGGEERMAQSRWRRWDARSGRWWIRGPSPVVHDHQVSSRCTRTAPCTWPEILARFPDASLAAFDGAVLLRAPERAGSSVVVDAVQIGVDRMTITFDFEARPAPRTRVPRLPPTSIPPIVDDGTQFVPLLGNTRGITVHRSVLMVHFADSTSRASRRAIIASVGGTVVGGDPPSPGLDGPYYVRVSSDSTGRRILAQGGRLGRLPQVVAASAISSMPTSRTDPPVLPLPPDTVPAWVYADSAALGFGNASLVIAGVHA